MPLLYNMPLMALATLFSVFTVYTLLDLSERLSTSRGPASTIWLVGGSIALGTALASLHFLALLALHRAIPIVLDMLTLLGAILVATLLAGITLVLLNRRSLRWPHLIGAGSCLSLSTLTTQYVEAAATPSVTVLSYDVRLAGVATAIAAGISFALVRLIMRLRERGAGSLHRLRLKLAGATGIGLALMVVQYAAIAASPFYVEGSAAGFPDGVQDTVVLGGRVVIAAVVILGLALLTSFVDRLASQTRAIEESRRRFESLVAHNPHAVIALDLNGCVVSSNPAVTRILGCTPDVLRQASIISLIPPDDQPRGHELFTKAAQGAPQNGEIAFTHQHGHRLDADLTIIPTILDETVVGVYAIIQDITERKRHEAAITRLERKHREIMDNATDLILAYDASGRFSFVNRAFHNLTGYTADEAQNLHLSSVLHPDDLPMILDHLMSSLHGKPVATQFEFRMLTREADTLYMHANVTAIKQDGSIVGVQAVARDITERKRLEHQLTYQAFHDALTELPNRSLFMDRLEHALARSRRHRSVLAVLFLDLDRFKVVNDSLGHSVGDRLLVEVARRLYNCIRPGDTVARLGGDEFTVLVDTVASIDDATTIATRIIEALEAQFTIGSHEIFISTSIGIALGSADRDNAEDLVRNADIAMYQAKHQGKARYAVFDPSMNERAWARLELEYDLRRALDREEFLVYYQPQIDLTTGGVMGVEALARWLHPQRGLIPPAEFIPIAEETGLIIPLGRQILQEACRKARAWHMQCPSGTPLVMHVNLSPRQFQHPGLVEELGQILRETGLTPACLDLEITESAVMEDVHATIDTLRGLKQLGVQLAIDDFGTGYSSLAYLKRFPVDFLKIDRSFVQGLGVDSEDTVIVQAMIGLAHSLGLEVIAEGVETLEQVTRLRELSCDAAQGYYFGRPVPADDLRLQDTAAGWTETPAVATKNLQGPTAGRRVPTTALGLTPS